MSGSLFIWNLEDLLRSYCDACLTSWLSGTTTEHISSFLENQWLQSCFYYSLKSTGNQHQHLFSSKKKSYPVDTEPQASAKCNFKVGHVNERERSKTMGSQICCGEGRGGWTDLMRDSTSDNQSNSFFNTDWHQDSL